MSTLKCQITLSLLVLALSVACAPGAASPATPVPASLPATTLPTSISTPEPTVAPTDTPMLEATQPVIPTERPLLPAVALSPLEIMQTDAQSILILAWAPDSSQFAAGTSSGRRAKTLIGNPMTGDWTLQIPIGTPSLKHVAWSPDGTILAVAAGEGRHLFRLLDAATGTPLTIFPASSATCMAWSPDGQVLAVGVEEGDIVLWKPPIGEEEAEKETEEEDPIILDGGNKRVKSVAWSPDGTRLAMTLNEDVILWGRGESMYKRLHTIQSAGEQVTWSPDGSMLVTAGKKSGVWNAETGDRLLELSVSILPAWSPDGAMIVTGMGKDVVVLDAKTGTVLFTAQKHARPVKSVAWSPDGTLIVSGDNGGLAIVWGVKIINN